ncbi:MAG: MerR family transcriptional regulator [Candidatus Zixiibacteriota bacterium]
METFVGEKLYYSIGEVEKITGIKPYVLRFWEKEFGLLRPKKNRAGNRSYQQKDIDLISQIKHLLYEEGYTIEGAKSRLKELRRDELGPVVVEKMKLQGLLEEIKRELSEILEILS